MRWSLSVGQICFSPASMTLMTPADLNLLADEIRCVRDRGGNERKAVEEWCEEHHAMFTTELLAQAMAFTDAKSSERSIAA
jgi:oligoribonuclease (3'-5' exoribonuclease)